MKYKVANIMGEKNFGLLMSIINRTSLTANPHFIVNTVSLFSNYTLSAFVKNRKFYSHDNVT